MGGRSGRPSRARAAPGTGRSCRTGPAGPAPRPGRRPRCSPAARAGAPPRRRSPRAARRSASATPAGGRRRWPASRGPRSTGGARRPGWRTARRRAPGRDGSGTASRRRSWPTGSPGPSRSYSWASSVATMLDAIGRLLEELGHEPRGDRLDGDHHHGLDRPTELVVGHGSAVVFVEHDRADTDRHEVGAVDPLDPELPEGLALARG